MEAWRSDWFEVTARHVRTDLLPEKWYVDYRVAGRRDRDCCPVARWARLATSD